MDCANQMIDSSRFLVFGGNGAIGEACAQAITSVGQVTLGNRNFIELEKQIATIDHFDGVIWAQGVNFADSSLDFNLVEYEEMMSANVTFVLNSLKVLLGAGKLKKNAQLVVLSSIWGQLSRPNKLSYGVSKAAIGGLVRSLAVDLGPKGIQVNSVAPGPIDTPMTIKNLSTNDLERIILESPLKRLVTLEEVVSVVLEVVTGKFSGMTGQEIILDGGWGVSKLV